MRPGPGAFAPAGSADAVSVNRGAALASAVLLVAEVVGLAVMWVLIPLAWMWVGGRAYNLTGSLGAYGAVAFFGFVFTAWRAMIVLGHIDAVWITLRRRAGYDQRDGALVRVVIVAFTVGLATFYAWYYLFSKAYV